MAVSPQQVGQMSRSRSVTGVDNISAFYRKAGLVSSHGLNAYFPTVCIGCAPAGLSSSLFSSVRNQLAQCETAPQCGTRRDTGDKAGIHFGQHRR